MPLILPLAFIFIKWSRMALLVVVSFNEDRVSSALVLVVTSSLCNSNSLAMTCLASSVRSFNVVLAVVSSFSALEISCFLFVNKASPSAMDFLACSSWFWPSLIWLYLLMRAPCENWFHTLSCNNFSSDSPTSTLALASLSFLLQGKSSFCLLASLAFNPAVASFRPPYTYSHHKSG